MATATCRRYAALLDPTQRKIKRALGPLQSLLRDSSIQEGPTWMRVEALLREFGTPNLQGGAAKQERY